MSTRRAATGPDVDLKRLDSFRELKGIGPATEHRLHEAGVYSWSALAKVLEAFGAVRINTEDRLRELFERAAARASETGGAQASPGLPGGERTESFIARISLSADGQPTHSVVTHVRTQTELPLAQWSPDEVIRFIEAQAQMRDVPAVQPPTSRAVPPPRQGTTTQSSREHVVDLDAGKTVGGRRNLEFTVSTTRAANLGEVDYRAALSGRPYGAAAEGSWAILGELSGKAQPPGSTLLRFEAVRLPPGLHRLRLQLTVRLTAPQRSAPALELEPPPRTPVNEEAA